MFSPAPTTPSAWSRTPLPQPQPNSGYKNSFPTPDKAMRITAGEKSQRNRAMRARKAEAEARKLADIARKAEGEHAKGLPTPISMTQNKKAQTIEKPSGQAEAPESEGDGATSNAPVHDLNNMFNTVVIGARCTNSLSGTRGSSSAEQEALETRNRYKVLGEQMENNAEEATPHEGETTAPDGSPAAAQTKNSDRKGKWRASAPRDTQTSAEGVGPTPTPSTLPKTRGAPYNISDSPLAGYRAASRAKRLLSRQQVGAEDANAQLADEELWRATDNPNLIIAFLENAGEGSTCLSQNPQDRMQREGPRNPASQAASPTSTKPDNANQLCAPQPPLPPVNLNNTTRQTDEMPASISTAHTSVARTNEPVEIPDTPRPGMPMLVDYDSESSSEHVQLPPHEPTIQTLRHLEFASLTQGFESPCGNNPWFAYNTLSAEQGCPTSQTEKARREEILSILHRTIGTQKEVRIVAPASTETKGGNKLPPHNFLVHNVSETYYDYVQGFEGCILMTKDTLFTGLNQPVFDTYVASISGFDDADEDQLRALVNKAIDTQNINALLEYVVSGQKHLEYLSTEDVVSMIRESLKVRIVESKGEGANTHRVAHIFLNPPTTDVTQWRRFRDRVMSASLKDPLLDRLYEYIRRLNSPKQSRRGGGRPMAYSYQDFLSLDSESLSPQRKQAPNYRLLQAAHRSPTAVALQADVCEEAKNFLGRKTHLDPFKPNPTRQEKAAAKRGVGGPDPDNPRLDEIGRESASEAVSRATFVKGAAEVETILKPRHTSRQFIDILSSKFRNLIEGAFCTLMAQRDTSFPYLMYSNHTAPNIVLDKTKLLVMDAVATPITVIWHQQRSLEKHENWPDDQKWPASSRKSVHGAYAAYVTHAEPIADISCPGDLWIMPDKIHVKQARPRCLWEQWHNQQAVFCPYDQRPQLIWSHHAHFKYMQHKSLKTETNRWNHGNVPERCIPMDRRSEDIKACLSKLYADLTEADILRVVNVHFKHLCQRFIDAYPYPVDNPPIVPIHIGETVSAAPVSVPTSAFEDEAALVPAPAPAPSPAPAREVRRSHSFEPVPSPASPYAPNPEAEFASAPASTPCSLFQPIAELSGSSLLQDFEENSSFRENQDRSTSDHCMPSHQPTYDTFPKNKYCQPPATLKGSSHVECWNQMDMFLPATPNDSNVNIFNCASMLNIDS
ncbi:hypothetical protein BC835DRAFT_1421734 [Cytidiella melzeri]|nr:hypothetical protein BC835DRAFT_1421734 [Cytidiella melzeri]